MSGSIGEAPIRRSPLHASHEALGAAWTGAGWPAGYGDVAAECAVVRDASGLADIGPLDKYTVRSASAARVLDTAGIPFADRAIIPAPSLGPDVMVWGLAPDEALIVGGAPLAMPIVAGATVIDMSSGISVLAIAGPRCRSILEELTPIDVADRAFADRSVASVALANVRAVIARHDVGVPRFLILIDRDLAEYVWDALLAIGAAHGLVPVGASAMAG